MQRCGGQKQPFMRRTVSIMKLENIAFNRTYIQQALK
jgi:hypothetical protein